MVTTPDFEKYLKFSHHCGTSLGYAAGNGGARAVDFGVGRLAAHASVVVLRSFSALMLFTFPKSDLCTGLIGSLFSVMLVGSAAGIAEPILCVLVSTL